MDSFLTPPHFPTDLILLLLSHLHRDKDRLHLLATSRRLHSLHSHIRLRTAMPLNIAHTLSYFHQFTRLIVSNSGSIRKQKIVLPATVTHLELDKWMGSIASLIKQCQLTQLIVRKTCMLKLKKLPNTLTHLTWESHLKIPTNALPDTLINLKINYYIHPLPKLPPKLNLLYLDKFVGSGYLSSINLPPTLPLSLQTLVLAVHRYDPAIVPILQNYTHVQTMIFPRSWRKDNDVSQIIPASVTTCIFWKEYVGKLPPNVKTVKFICQPTTSLLL